MFIRKKTASHLPDEYPYPKNHNIFLTIIPSLSFLRNARTYLPRCKPYGFDPQFFVQAQNFKRFFHRLHTVVHSRQNMIVPIGETVKYPAFFQRIMFSEWPKNHMLQLFANRLFTPSPDFHRNHNSIHSNRNDSRNDLHYRWFHSG